MNQRARKTSQAPEPPWRRRSHQSGIIRRGPLPGDPTVEEIGASRREPTERKTTAPLRWDLPLPPHSRTGEVSHRPLRASELEELRAEGAREELPRAASRTARALLRLSAQPGSGVSVTDAVRFAREVGVHLLEERCADLLLNLVRALESLRPGQPAVEDLVRELTGTRLRERFVAEPVPDQRAALLELLTMRPAGHLRAAMEGLVAEPEPAQRYLLEAIVARLGPADPTSLLAFLGGAPSKLAASIFSFVCATAPERSVQASMALALHRDAELQMMALQVLATAPASAALRRVLRCLLSSTSLDVRMAAALVYASRAQARAFEPLRAALDDAVRGDASLDEAAALGLALARSDPERALACFTEWVDGQGLGRALNGNWPFTTGRALSSAAISGLSALGGPPARHLLSTLARRTDGELASRCRSALREARGGQDDE